jgi:hypothetical protein
VTGTVFRLLVRKTLKWNINRSEQRPWRSLLFHGKHGVSREPSTFHSGALQHIWFLEAWSCQPFKLCSWETDRVDKSWSASLLDCPCVTSGRQHTAYFKRVLTWARQGTLATNGRSSGGEQVHTQNVLHFSWCLKVKGTGWQKEVHSCQCKHKYLIDTFGQYLYLHPEWRKGRSLFHGSHPNSFTVFELHWRKTFPSGWRQMILDLKLERGFEACSTLFADYLKTLSIF